MSSPFICTTSTFADGNMSPRFDDAKIVQNNRTNFLLQHGLAFDDHVCMRCDHGTVIATVDKTTPLDSDRMLDAEVLVTTTPSLVLMLLTADCLPVTFFDPVHQVLALAHFSRQTTAALLPQQVITYLKNNYKTDPHDLKVHVGPHIHAASYKFPLPLPERATAIAPFIVEKDGYAHIDVEAAALAQLIAEGVQEDAITIDPADTGTDDCYFSYYRSKREDRPDGRIATIAYIHELSH